jgi:hypothetical protein
MLSMLVLLWTLVAMFRLSGAPMIRDDLQLVTRAQSAGPLCSVPVRPSSRTCAHIGEVMIVAVIVTTFSAADRP